MFQALHVKNFRCLRDVTLEFGAFTVFVGPNGSGKTAVADVLTMTGGLPASDHWRHKGVPSFSATWTNGERRTVRTPAQLGGLRQWLTLSPAALKGGQQANEAWMLDGTRGNLANFFDTLSRPDQERFVADF